MINRCAFLTLHEWDYIQTVLSRKGTKYDWFLIKKLDEELGGHFPNNHTW